MSDYVHVWKGQITELFSSNNWESACRLHIEVTMGWPPSLSVSNWSASDRITRVSSIEHSQVKRPHIQRETPRTQSSSTDNFPRLRPELTADQMCVDDSRSAITGLNVVCAARPAVCHTNVGSEQPPAVQRRCPSVYHSFDDKSSWWLGFSGIRFLS